MKRILKYFPLTILVVYLIKSFLISPELFDFGVISLMSGLFLYTLKLDKDELSSKEELLDIIAQLEGKVNEKIDTVQKSQDEDRLAYEGKFSTLNLGMQRQGKPIEKKNYGWGS